MNEQKFSQLLRPWLDASAQTLSYRTVHRLEAGRRAAIKAIGASLAGAQLGQTATAVGKDTLVLSPQNGFSIWNKMSIGASALVLVLGMFAISDWRAETDAEESAVEDAQMLTDDLPLTAYADHGFGVFMKNTRHDSNGQ